MRQAIPPSDAVRAWGMRLFCASLGRLFRPWEDSVSARSAQQAKLCIWYCLVCSRLASTNIDRGSFGAPHSPPALPMENSNCAARNAFEPAPKRSANGSLRHLLLPADLERMGPAANDSLPQFEFGVSSTPTSCQYFVACLLFSFNLLPLGFQAQEAVCILSIAILLSRNAHTAHMYGSTQ